jgi:predicted DCC family thiol-disulfide oxidoreductase YuxK
MTFVRRSRPLFVFDGHCALCSGGVAFLLRHDRRGRIDYLSAQSPLGQAIYTRLGLPVDASYLFIDDAGTHVRSAGYFRLADALGGWWRLGKVFALVPRPVRDWLYDRLAANRYRLFGNTEQCALLSPEQRVRLLTDDPELRAQLA